MQDHSARTKILNMSIRATTLACRFLFIFFLAKTFSPYEVGLYGLVTATVGYSLYFVGLDFYTYTTRELASHSHTVWGGLLKNQAVLSLSLYCVVLPLLTLIFVSGMLPWELAKWFFLLIVLEHICQELTRFFIAASEQLAASILQFLRQGIWAIFIVMLMLFEERFRELHAVFGAWVLACIAAIAFSIRKFRVMNVGGWQSEIDREWIWRGVKVAVPLLIATLAINGVFTIDRYWLQHLVGLEVVGAYVLFIGVANTLIAFLDAGVYAFSYPVLIAAYRNNDPVQYRKKFREMLFLTVIACSSFSVISVTLLPYLLKWLDQDVYTQNYLLFYWLLLAFIFKAIGTVLHYAVYSQGRDRPIIQSHLAALLVFILVTFLASPWSPLFAVPLGLCASQLFIGIWKLRAYLQTTPEPFLGIAKA